VERLELADCTTQGLARPSLLASAGGLAAGRLGARLGAVALVTASLLIVGLCNSGESSAKSCFGAAARDTLQRDCLSSSINLKVYPTPQAASKLFWATGVDRNANLCSGGLLRRDGLIACNLGVPETQAAQSIALIGDSHSAHWRPGFDLAAKRAKWSVVSLVQSGCDYTSTQRIRFVGDQAACRSWRLRIPSWLKQHPRIHTVVFAQNSTYEGNPADEVKSYQRAWKKLPPTVERIVVLRDNPHAKDDNAACIERAIRGRIDAGRACPNPRSAAITADLAARAASELNRPDVHVIDLTRFYCGSRSCFPVIGGALVYAQGNHLTPTFNKTLGPYLLEALNKYF
jgi:SGNH domain (fused to AT3 domains)